MRLSVAHVGEGPCDGELVVVTPFGLVTQPTTPVHVFRAREVETVWPLHGLYGRLMADGLTLPPDAPPEESPSERGARYRFQGQAVQIISCFVVLMVLLACLFGMVCLKAHADTQAPVPERNTMADRNTLVDPADL